MTAPTVITDLSAAIASNPPAGGDAPFPDLDNYLRGIQGVIRRAQAIGTNIASASTINIGASVDGDIINITGTTAITELGTIAAGVVRLLVFSGVLTVTHHATKIIMPSGMNYKTSAGDVLGFVSLGSNSWRCIYQSRKQTEIDMIGVAANITLPVGYSAKYTVGAPVAGLSLYLGIGGSGAQHYLFNFGDVVMSGSNQTIFVRANGTGRSTTVGTSIVGTPIGSSHTEATASGDLVVGYSSLYGNVAQIAIGGASVTSNFNSVVYYDGTNRGVISKKSYQAVVVTELSSLFPDAGTFSGSFSVTRML
jgi:hypothetical protein